MNTTFTKEFLLKLADDGIDINRNVKIIKDTCQYEGYKHTQYQMIFKTKENKFFRFYYYSIFAGKNVIGKYNQDVKPFIIEVFPNKCNITIIEYGINKEK